MSVTIQRASKGQIVNLSDDAAGAIEFHLRDQRRVWNLALRLNEMFYRNNRQFVFYHELAACLTIARTVRQFNAGGVAAQQQCLRAFDRALRESLPSASSRKGFPKPRKRTSDCSIRVPAVSVKTVRQDGEITHVGFPKIGLLRVHNLRVPPGAKINSFSLTTLAGKYYVSVQYAVEIEVPKPSNDRIIGIDSGLSVYATLSNGEQVQALRPFRSSVKRLRRAQRALSRKRRGSINYRRQRQKVARVHARIADVRRNAQHQLSRHLVDEHGTVAIETLSLAGLKRLKHQGKAWSDIGVGELYRQVRYKAETAGVTVYEHPRFARSTGCCPDCGYVGEKLPLYIRSWSCPACGREHDRDIAAARWLALCARQASQVGAACPEPSGAPPQTKRGKRGSNRAVAVMRSDPSGPPAHDGSPANRPSMRVAQPHASKG